MEQEPDSGLDAQRQGAAGTWRQRQWWVRHAPTIAFAAGLALAALLVLLDRWRRGTFLFGVVTVAAGIYRWWGDPERMGLLAVRTKPQDTAFLLVFGSAIIYLSASIDSLGTDS